MLLVTLTCLDDQTVAERMRRVAQRMHAAAPFTEWAVDEAVSVYRETHNTTAAINAGVAFLNRVFEVPGSAVREPEPVQPRTPFAWVEDGRVIALGWVIALALVFARANGWLP